MSKSEAEVFGGVENPLWTKYICYKVFCKTINVKPPPPEVWVCGQMLMLIDKGEVKEERAEAEEALTALGWELYTNTKGQLALRPCPPEWCEEHEQPMWKNGLKCGGCLEQS